MDWSLRLTQIGSSRTPFLISQHLLIRKSNQNGGGGAFSVSVGSSVMGFVAIITHR